MPRTINQLKSVKAKNPSIEDAKIILEHTHNVANSFLSTYKELRKGKVGGTNDSEQDLLRAMLVFATAGLDALLKQLVNDTLDIIIERDEGANTQLQAFVAGQLKNTDIDGLQKNSKFLSLILTSDSPKELSIKLFKRDRTSGSLQSKEEVLRIASAFAIKPEELKISMDKLDEIFKVRNIMIHEMDVNLNGQNRKRNHRGVNEMIEYTNVILELSETFFHIINKRITVKGNS